MKLASLDIGLKRIGIAFCFDGTTVLPQKAIFRKNRNQASSEVSTLLKEWQIDKLIVGIPQDGSSSEDMEKRIKHFTSLLNFNNEITYFDESFSSFEAKEKLKGEIKQKKDGRIDSVSAGLILERYLFGLGQAN